MHYCGRNAGNDDDEVTEHDSSSDGEETETDVFVRYGYHQRENTGSRLFTDVKPCWTGLISGWVTISI